MSYLFTRRLRLAPGNLLDSMTWSAKITEKVNAISEVPVSLVDHGVLAKARDALLDSCR